MTVAFASLQVFEIPGARAGTQYRSAIYYLDAAQEETARAVLDDLRAEDIFGAPIVTEVAALDVFYPAEEYHRAYYRNNPGQGTARS